MIDYKQTETCSSQHYITYMKVICLLWFPDISCESVISVSWYFLLHLKKVCAFILKARSRNSVIWSKICLFPGCFLINEILNRQKHWSFGPEWIRAPAPSFMSSEVLFCSKEFQFTEIQNRKSGARELSPKTVQTKFIDSKKSDRWTFCPWAHWLTESSLMCVFDTVRWKCSRPLWRRVSRRSNTDETWTSCVSLQAQLTAILHLMSREAARHICRVFRELHDALVKENRALRERAAHLESELRSKVERNRGGDKTVYKIKPSGQSVRHLSVLHRQLFL